MPRGPTMRRTSPLACVHPQSSRSCRKGGHGTDRLTGANLRRPGELSDCRSQVAIYGEQIDRPIDRVGGAKPASSVSSPCVGGTMAALAPQQQQGEQKRQKVMVAVDESECSHHALEWALRNLAPVLATPLLVLTVQPLVPLGYLSAAAFGAPLGTTVVAPELIKSMQEQQKQLTRALLDKAKAICAEHGVAVETVVEVGDAKEMICEAAEKSNVDLLILGSHSRGPVQRLFLGSVSNYCMHHAKCPVLVVKKQG